MPSVEQRLDRIESLLAAAERRERFWRRGAMVTGTALLAGVCGALAATGARSPDIAEVVRTGRLEIIGVDGKAVLVATGAPHGGQLDIWNRGGANTLRLGSSEFGGDIVLWNDKGQQAASAFVTADGGRFEACWGDGAPGFVAGVSRDRGAAVSISNGSGREVLYAGSNKVGAGLLRVGRPDGATAAAVVSGPGGGVFEAFSASGEATAPLAVIGAGDGGTSGMIQVSGATGDAAAKPVFEVDSKNDGGGRVMIGAGGAANVVLESGPQEAGLLSFFTGGRRVAALGGGVAGGQVNLADLEGRPVVVMGAAADGAGGAITVRGGAGQPAVRANADTHGNGELVVYSANGQRKRVFTGE